MRLVPASNGGARRGGRLSLTLFYLANPWKIANAPRAKCREFADWSQDLRGLLTLERTSAIEEKRRLRRERKNRIAEEVRALAAAGQNRNQIVKALSLSWHTVAAILK